MSLETYVTVVLFYSVYNTQASSVITTKERQCAYESSTRCSKRDIWKFHSYFRRSFGFYIVKFSNSFPMCILSALTPTTMPHDVTETLHLTPTCCLRNDLRVGITEQLLYDNSLTTHRVKRWVTNLSCFLLLYRL